MGTRWEWGTGRAAEHEFGAVVPLEQKGEVRAAALPDSTCPNVTRAQAVVVEELADTVQDQQWRLRAHANASISLGNSDGEHDRASTAASIPASANAASRSRWAWTGPSRKTSRTSDSGASSSARFRSPPFQA